MQKWKKKTKSNNSPIQHERKIKTYGSNWKHWAWNGHSNGLFQIEFQSSKTAMVIHTFHSLVFSFFCVRCASNVVEMFNSMFTIEWMRPLWLNDNYLRTFFLVMYMEFRSCHSKYIRIKCNQILIDRANNHLMLSLLFLSLRTHSLHLSFECSAMCQIDFSLEYELDLRFSLQCELCWR